MTEVLAVDLGGTNFRMARVSGDGEILVRDALPTREVESIEAGLKRLIEMVGGEGIDELVFGAPGVVDFEAGTVPFAANLPSELREGIVVGRLESEIAKRVTLINDADLAAMAEARIGAGQGAETLVYVTCSTGFGAGLVHRGELFRSRFSGLEVGHTRLGLEYFDEAERLGSGTALARIAKGNNLNITPEELVKRAVLVDGTERDLLRVTIEALGVALANLAWLFAPDRIVVGGGLGLSAPLVLELAQEYFDGARPEYLEGLELRAAELGDDAGLRGAPFVAVRS